MKRAARQPSLFDPPPPPPQPVDFEFVRKHLGYYLRVVERAQRMPWSENETFYKEKLYVDLAGLLPAEEGEDWRAQFAAQLRRLRETEEKAAARRALQSGAS